MDGVAALVGSTLLYKVCSWLKMSTDDREYCHIEGGLYGSEEVAHENKVLFGVFLVEFVLMGQEIIKTVVICHFLQVLDLLYLQS